MRESKEETDGSYLSANDILTDLSFSAAIYLMRLMWHFPRFVFFFINWINAWNEATEWGFFNINLIIAATNFFNSETYVLHMASFILNTQYKQI